MRLVADYDSIASKYIKMLRDYVRETNALLAEEKTVNKLCLLVEALTNKNIDSFKLKFVCETITNFKQFFVTLLE